MTSPYNLEALLAKVREVRVDDRPKPLPCAHWCALEALPSRSYPGAMGHCTCSEPCQWESCPMDVESFVMPPVPTFRKGTP